MTSPSSSASSASSAPLGWLAKAGSWLFLTARVRQARSQVATSIPERERAANQARLLGEVARRVAEPVEALPAGATAPVQLALAADAARWAFIALGATASEGDTRLLPLWESVDGGVLAKAAGGDVEALALLKTTLCALPPGGELGASARDATMARKFVDALVWQLDAPARDVEHLLVQRWLRVTVLAALLVGGAVGARALWLGPNLLANRPFTTSSTYEPCAHKGMCAELMFHTLPQDNPWVEFDLGALKPVRRVELTNRSDCCFERIAGLVVELSTDKQGWTEVGHNPAVFTKWTLKFPKRPARYLRLRLPKPNGTLHLDDVVVR